MTQPSIGNDSPIHRSVDAGGGVNPKLSAVVITLNEARNIRACLASIRFCDQIIVVDSGSEDLTRDIASSEGARVLERPFDNFAAQKNFGIERASGEWVLLLDADERISDALRDEILREIGTPSADGYAFVRQNRIFGRWMRYGANADDVQLRLVRRLEAHFEGLVHERVRTHGRTKTLRSPLLHHSTDTVSDYMKKLNSYTRLEVENFSVTVPRGRKNSLMMKPFLRLAQLLVLKRAFLDGFEGLLFTVLSAYYDFVTQAKRWERAPRKRRIA